jgi:hypothetical protein
VVSWFVLLGRCVVRRGTGRRLFFSGGETPKLMGAFLDVS